MNRMVVKLLVLNLFVGAAAFASVRDSVGIWKGNGVSYDGQAKKQGSFAVQVTNTEETGGVKSAVQVTLPDGSVKHYEQHMQDKSSGFAIQSDLGIGGGTCFAKGLCEAYLKGSSGRDFAINIVLDGTDAQRILVTEIESGKAVGFVAERLAKEN